VNTRNIALSAEPAAFPWRRVTLVCLVAAGIVAAAALAGPTWLVRVGGVVGIAAGVVAAVLAVRALRRLDESHREAAGEQVIDLERAHGEQLRAHRTKDAGVAEALRAEVRRQDRANTQLRERITRADEVIGQQRTTLDSLHAECDGLRTRIAERDRTISGLRESLGAREQELAALLEDVGAAEVYAMPRRVRSAARAAEPEENELVDLATVQAATPPTDEPALRQQA